MNRPRPRLTALLLFLSVAVAWAAELQVSVISLSSPMAPSSDAALEIQTTPGAGDHSPLQVRSVPGKGTGAAASTGLGTRSDAMMLHEPPELAAKNQEPVVEAVVVDGAVGHGHHMWR